MYVPYGTLRKGLPGYEHTVCYVRCCHFPQVIITLLQSGTLAISYLGEIKPFVAVTLPLAAAVSMAWREATPLRPNPNYSLTGSPVLSCVFLAWFFVLRYLTALLLGSDWRGQYWGAERRENAADRERERERDREMHTQIWQDCDEDGKKSCPMSSGVALATRGLRLGYRKQKQ